MYLNIICNPSTVKNILWLSLPGIEPFTPYAYGENNIKVVDIVDFESLVFVVFRISDCLETHITYVDLVMEQLIPLLWLYIVAQILS